MARYVTIRLTQAQAHAASNACDLIRNQIDADGDNKRESACYQRASDAIDLGIASSRVCGIRLSMGEAYGIIRCALKHGHHGRHRPQRPRQGVGG